MLRASSLYNVPQALAAGVGIKLLADGLALGIERNRHIVVHILSVPGVLWSWRRVN